MLQKIPQNFALRDFLYYFILFKHLFRLIQPLDHRVGII